MRVCRGCQFPLDSFGLEHCPKCDSTATREVRRGIFEVDIAHRGETWEDAREKIQRALDRALFDGYAALKIVHGYGSLSGESIIAPRARAYLRHLAEEIGGRFVGDRHNTGASLIWLNR